MISTLLLATNNSHKIKEIQFFLKPLGIHTLSLNDLNITIPEEVENQNTYQENAKAKCAFVSQFSDLPILADDSGLEIPSLQNKPGIYSARYAGTGTDKDNRERILQEMSHLKGKQRDAHFICILCLYYHQTYYYFEGISNGTILHQEKGECGFGYDSIFACAKLKKTYAELTFEEKLSVSHRGEALKKLKTWLKK